MMSSTEAPISITVKTAAGSLVTVRAETPEELDSLVANGLAAISSAATELETAVRGASASPASSINQAVGLVASGLSGQVVDTPPFNAAPIGGGRSCPHGKMTGIQGQSKQGGVYKGYFCPSAQGDPSKCKTIYVDKNNPEWNTFVPDRIK
jgi:hypothetical protein